MPILPKFILARIHYCLRAYRYKFTEKNCGATLIQPQIFEIIIGRIWLGRTNMKSLFNLSKRKHSEDFGLGRLSRLVGTTFLVSAIALGTAVLPPLVFAPQKVEARNVNDAVAKLKRSERRWIEIRLRSQRLMAWEGDRRIMAVIISTGKSGTDTPRGAFSVQSKHRLARMQGDDYNVPDVPHAMYYFGNYAIHGTYWHNSFGIPVSHGCINVAPDHAAWLYRWASVGTPVVVRD
jgi:lipoprotein-anchoring transpeptidase ErfK/SrfK